MKNYLKNDIILVRYPFSDLSSSKVRPAVIINAPYVSEDLFIVPLTSKTTSLLQSEFVLKDWNNAGLNVITAVKRGVYTINKALVIKRIGQLSAFDSTKLENYLLEWLGFKKGK